MKSLALVIVATTAACHPAQGDHATTPGAGAAAPPITLCKTTEAELRGSLGEPTRDGYYHDARVTSWILGEGHGGVIRYLAVLVDERGIVVDRVWNIPTEIPWLPANQCARSGSDEANPIPP